MRFKKVFFILAILLLLPFALKVKGDDFSRSESNAISASHSPARERVMASAQEFTEEIKEALRAGR